MAKATNARHEWTDESRFEAVNDVFARDVLLTRLEEGDLVAFCPAGAYGSSMASEHRLRGLPAEELAQG